ncbi:MAG TPA: dihydroneopterin aldolase [Casimicrobiaceae bacterium]
MNTIIIHDLRVQTTIGIYRWEAHLPQTIRLDLEIGMPSAQPFESGDFADALDYASIVRRIKAYTAGHAYPLMERFAQGLADIVLQEFGVPWVKLRVVKLAALPGVKEIGIAIERHAK